VRILLVNDYATPTAGAELITLHLRDALRTRGHDVRTLASRAQLIPGESFADVTCFGTTTRLQTLTSAVNPSAARALKRELESFQPDVVQLHMFLWQLSPAILPLLRDIPAVYYAMTFKAVCPTGLKWLPAGTPCVAPAGMACLKHGCVSAAAAPPLMTQQYLWRRRRRALAAVVCCSNAVRQQLDANEIGVREVIWPGTPVVDERAPLRGPPTVAYAGRLVPEKGVNLLIQAFARMRPECPEARLVIAGTGPQESALRALILQLGISDAVEMHDHLAPGQLASTLERAWVHVVPSRWPEPFGLTATEAMMRGTAVIASRIGGLAESVMHDVTGLHVPPGDEVALAHAMLRILGDRALAERLGAAGRRRALALFSIERSTTQFERLYDTLTSETLRARAV